MTRKRILLRLGALALVIILVALSRAGVISWDQLARELPAGETPKSSPAPAPSSPSSPSGATDVAAGDGVLNQAIRDQQSGVIVEAAGIVTKLLPDDNDGSRHQRFIIRLASGDTILIAHNIDLAPRVPVAQGDEISFKGQYEWNDRGGVVHWTHHDPKGWRDDGWIKLDGETYK